MKPIDPVGAAERAVTFAENQDEYQALPARVGGDTVYTRWRLTLRERLAVLLGRCIDIEILTRGEPLQPLLPYVQGMEPTEEDMGDV